MVNSEMLWSATCKLVSAYQCGETNKTLHTKLDAICYGLALLLEHLNQTEYHEGETNVKSTKCDECYGLGYIEFEAAQGNMAKRKCSKCGGSGKFVNTKNLKCLKNENVATVFIVNYDTSEVLLLMHKKFHKWIPPGGHCEEGEHPHQTAIREVFEEVGLELEDNLKTHVNTKPTLVPAPMWVQLENIYFGKPDYHLHMDYIYLAYVPDRIAQTLYAKEGMKIQWLSLLLLNDLEAIGLREEDFYANTLELMRDIRDFYLPNDVYSFWIN